MTLIVSRARSASLPNYLAWRALGFRTICSARLGFAPSDPHSPASAGTKVTYRVVTLETGKIARFANGSVVLGMDQTKVLSTVACAKTDSPKDFLPLFVDYQEKQYAQGLIPNSYMRREGAPKERELLCGWLIDRPIRPLFPSGFYHEVQIMTSVLSPDGKQDPDKLAANASSAALMLSDVPWGGPIGVIRIGRIGGQFAVNPTMDELSSSDLNLIYACTRDKTMMIYVQAREISEKDLAAALRLAHPEAVKYLDPQIRLAAQAGKQKKEYKLSMLSEKTLEKVTDLASTRIESVFTDPSYGKFERGEALDNIGKDVKKVFEENDDQESLSVLPKAVDTVRKKMVRSRMISNGFRVDRRHLDEDRPIYCEEGHQESLSILPKAVDKRRNHQPHIMIPVSQSLTSNFSMIRRLVILNAAVIPHKYLRVSLFSTSPPEITPPFIHKCKTISQVKLIHGKLLSFGILTLNRTSHLISTYISLGCSSAAVSLLRKFPPSDAGVYHWNSLIRKYIDNGRPNEGLSLFRLMHYLSWTPDNYTFPFILKACGEISSFRFGVSAHALSRVTGFYSNVFVGNALVAMYSRCGSLADARKVFDEISVIGVWDVVSWNSIIESYAKLGKPKMALAMFCRMTNEFGFRPDDITLVNVIPPCASLGAHSQGKQLHGFAITSEMIQNMFVGNCLLDMYAKCGMMDEANTVLLNMSVKDLVSWNAMVAGYSQIGRFDDAVKLFEKMHEEKITMDVVTWSAAIAGYAQRGLGYEALGVCREMLSSRVKPNEVTLISVLSGCASVGALMHGKEIHCYAIKHPIDLRKNGHGDDNMVINQLIDMYAKCKKVDIARAMFDSLSPKERDVVTWTVMIGGYSQHGEANKALILLSEMFEQDYQTRPNAFTISCALVACASLAALRIGKQIHAYTLRNNKNAVPLFVSNCLIDMYAKCGDIGDARLVFDNTIERNEVTWTSLMTGYGMHGYGEEALGIFDEMLKIGFKLDGVTLLVVLYACSHSGMINQGMEYFKGMKTDFGVSPGPEHYACMVDLLGRAGRLNAALRLIEEMPMEPPPVVWVALLSSCRIHRKVELGEYAAKKITELACNNDGSYTLLSNLYANARRWKDVARIRSLMRHKGVKKRPGCSWIEGIKGTTTFFVGDKTHPRAKEIYHVLSDYMQRIKDIGYVPETDFALHDVDDEEKGDLLFEHSEKLALAYGILITPQGAAIRIAKNLRVCGDCHNAFTYMSRIIDHEIILRDSSRFHHFKNGMCSCKGYW